jgi:hypothetical protein
VHFEGFFEGVETFLTPNCPEHSEGQVAVPKLILFQEMRNKKSKNLYRKRWLILIQPKIKSHILLNYSYKWYTLARIYRQTKLKL